MIRQSYKDSLFRFLFGQEANKEWLLSLYNTLNHSNYQNPDDIELTTIQDILYLGMKNDISFIIQDNMVLLEHQSTISKNIAIRFLLYYAKVLEAYLKTKGINIYRHTRIQLPNPQFIVLYNGLEKAKEYEETGLSINYTDTDIIDMKVKFYNLNKGHNEGLKEGCEVLKEYCWVNDQIVSNRDKMNLEEAVELMYKNLPEDFKIYKIMMKHKVEVRGMVLSTFDKETFGKTMYEDGYDEGRQLGNQEGRIESKQEIAKNMKAMGFDDNTIAKATGLSKKEIKEM